MNLESKIFEWLIVAITGLLGYVWLDTKKQIKDMELKHEKLTDRQKDMESNLSAHRENAAEKYVTRAEVKSDLADIKQLIRDVSLKLDSKADK